MSSVDTPRDLPPRATAAPRGTLDRVWAIVPHVLALAFLIALSTCRQQLPSRSDDQVPDLGLLAMSLGSPR